MLKKSRFSICCFDPKPEATRTCRSISTQVREFRDLIQKLTSNSCSLTWKEPSSGGIMLRARTSHIFKDCDFSYIVFWTILLFQYTLWKVKYSLFFHFIGLFQRPFWNSHFIFYLNKEPTQVIEINSRAI